MALGHVNDSSDSKWTLKKDQTVQCELFTIKVGFLGMHIKNIKIIKNASKWWADYPFKKINSCKIIVLHIVVHFRLISTNIFNTN